MWCFLPINACGDKSCKSVAAGARPHPSHPSSNVVLETLSDHAILDFKVSANPIDPSSNIVLDISFPNAWHHQSWLDPRKSFRLSNITSMASSDPRNAKGREVELLVRWRDQSSPALWSRFWWDSAFSPGARRILGKCWRWLDRAVCWVLGRRTRYSLVVQWFKAST